jgi:hypothetical protein
MSNDYPNIYITANAPLIVRDVSANMHYGTVYLEQGAYIEIRVGSRFEIDKLTMDLDHRETLTPYPTLYAGESLKDARYHIILTGTDAPDGKKGANGSDWGEHGGHGNPPASPGGNAPSTFTLTIHELTFDVSISSTGGNGGKGGDGGNGANGFDGSDTEHPGGIGGDGGNGANGGNGGNAAAKLTVQYASLGDYWPSVDCSPGAAGSRGEGGIHGRNGKYYNSTTQPNDGTPGSAGLPGQKGTAEINKLT